MQKEVVPLANAIKEMKALTKKGQAFAIQFVSFSISTGKSEGLKVVQNAVLRNPPALKDDQYREFKLYYFDVETQTNGQLWLPCLLEFNNQEITLK